MRIAMIGQKGVPATHGGVERHVEELGARLASRGHDVVVFTRPNYTDRSLTAYRGMTLKSLPTIGTKHLDAIVHSAVASMTCFGGGFDIVHYHAIGPCLTSPLVRVRGRRVVATIHGQDWRRAKWSSFATGVLRIAEHIALSVPNATISVSRSLSDAYRAEGWPTVHYIPNGVSIPPGDDASYLDELGLEDGRYVLFAGRLVPEKGLHHLIEAYRLNDPGMPLVVAGDTSFSSAYVERIKEQAQEALFVGYQYGDRLAALFRHCALFVLPSDLEGLPIVLLEALAYGAPVLASDIPPNVEVLGERGAYFTAGDPVALATVLHELVKDVSALRDEASSIRDMALQEYDWDTVALQTEELYEAVLGMRLAV